MTLLSQPCLASLSAELAWLNALIEATLAPAVDKPEPFRAMYVSDGEFERLLKAAGSLAPPPRNDRAVGLRTQLDAASPTASGPLSRLQRVFGLSAFERHALLLALAPAVDTAYERIFAYLNDDFTRRRPNPGLALRLLPHDDRAEALAAFSPNGTLFRLGLLDPADASGLPLLSRPLVADEGLVSFALRGDQFEPDLEPAVPGQLATLRWQGQFDSLVPLVGTPQLVLHLEGPEGTGRRALARALCGEAGMGMLSLDLGAIAPLAAATDILALFRRAAILGACVCLSGADAMAADVAHPLRPVLGHAIGLFERPVFIASEAPWAGRILLGGCRILSVRLPPPGLAIREALWRQFAGDAGLEETALDWADLAARFRLTPGAMQAALAGARDLARLRHPATAADGADLTEACYAQSSTKLAIFARPLATRRGWSDLTVPANARAQLLELCAQVRQRRRVYDDWGFGRSAAKGLCALFYGPSGAGKTMAAEVIGSELQLRIYRIDLSLVVSKYIGETEKNLSRVFDEAQTSNAILFFDEADALFGKRSEVKDAHDRYANIEINYLLQRIEEFDGLVILASNLRKNIDDAFFRRMQATIEFPLPDAEHRFRIWKQHIPPRADLSPDVDFSFLAERFAVTGGNIRNIVLNAAFLAAEQRQSIGMAHFVKATRREYDKIGLACTRADFGPYQSFLGEQ
jgi:AAA+ superfamily predicted ATPase